MKAVMGMRIFSSNNCEKNEAAENSSVSLTEDSMLAKSTSAVLAGIDAIVVEIEFDIVRGLPGFAIIGLPDSTIKESKDRIRSAVENSGYEFPPQNFVANLAPAFCKKQGSGFDLALALALLKSTGQLTGDIHPALGELSLDGRVRPVRGALSMAIALHRAGYDKLVISEENAEECAVVEGLDCYAVNDLRGAVAAMKGGVDRYAGRHSVEEPVVYQFDFAHVYGQESVRRAMEIAAAGNHNVLMYGPPGSGKSLIAKCVPSILPPLTREQSIETTMIHSAGGILNSRSGLIRVPPFRTPHHTASDIALVGGGRIPSVGEISLAHNGVLFLDEFSEFQRTALQTLRQPMEDFAVTISRASGNTRYPCDFMLVAATNPCQCGYFFDSEIRCRCSPGDITRYRKILSGPVIDRIDLEVYVPRIPYEKLVNRNRCEDSASIRSRVEKARMIQRERFSGSGTRFNSRMSSHEVRKFCGTDADAVNLFEQAVSRLRLSSRSLFRVMKVARTIADMDSSESIRGIHAAEALSYKNISGRYS